MLNHILNGFLYRYGGSIYVSFEPFKYIIVIWLIYSYVCRTFCLDFIVLHINFFYQDYPGLRSWVRHCVALIWICCCRCLGGWNLFIYIIGG